MATFPRVTSEKEEEEKAGDLFSGLFTKAPSIFSLQVLYIHIMIYCYRILGII